MQRQKLKNDQIARDMLGIVNEFPKYTTQLINLANGNAQGTRPKMVGQLSDLFGEFDGSTFDEWATWYLDRFPDAISEATDKIMPMIDQMRDAFTKIDRKMGE